MDEAEFFLNWTKVENSMSFQGYRQYIAYTYIGFNLIGFIVNSWVMYVVAPLLFAPAIKVPRSIIFYILSLCIADLMIMFGMLLLIIELVFGTWQFSSFACTSYLVFDSMNKFVAPIIVFLISRTCYATICMDKKASQRAAGLKWAIIQVSASLGGVMVLLWPVFAYSEVYTFHLNANNDTKTVFVMHKCSFLPPPQVELYFNLTSCVMSYAIPLFGIIYWYVSVPFFLKRRALTTLVASSSSDVAIKKIVRTVLILTTIYVCCWSPYWLSMFAHRFWQVANIGKRSIVIISYIIHLLPYVSCSAYPLIFTLMNRGIKAAHAKMVEDHRRRFRSITDEASHQIRSARLAIQNSFPSRFSSFLSGLRASDASAQPNSLFTSTCVDPSFNSSGSFRNHLNDSQRIDEEKNVTEKSTAESPKRDTVHSISDFEGHETLL